MKKMFLSAVVALAASASAAMAGSSTTVGYWNFNNNDLPGGGFGFLADPSVFPLGADVGNASLSIGGGILNDTIVNGNGDTVYQWLQSFGGTTINAQDGDPGGGSLSVQGGTDVANNGSYFEFSFDMTGLSNLSVSYATRGTGSGFNTQTWSYSTDGVNFVDFEVVEGTNVTSFFLVDLGTLTALDGAAEAFLRVTFDGATGSTGNNRLDNILMTAIPGPGGLALLGLAGFGVSRRRRR